MKQVHYPLQRLELNWSWNCLWSNPEGIQYTDAIGGKITSYTVKTWSSYFAMMFAVFVREGEMGISELCSILQRKATSMYGYRDCDHMTSMI